MADDDGRNQPLCVKSVHTRGIDNQTNTPSVERLLILLNLILPRSSQLDCENPEVRNRKGAECGPLNAWDKKTSKEWVKNDILYCLLEKC